MRCDADSRDGVGYRHKTINNGYRLYPSQMFIINILSAPRHGFTSMFIVVWQQPSSADPLDNSTVGVVSRQRVAAAPRRLVRRRRERHKVSGRCHYVCECYHCGLRATASSTALYDGSLSCLQMQVYKAAAVCRTVPHVLV